MKILMCRPRYYGIYYEINPWMDINQPADSSLAEKQWENLYATLLKTGACVELIEPIAGLPDMVFTANAGIVYNNQVWIANFRSRERQTESSYFKDWFVKAGFAVVNAMDDFKQPPYFEGAGDALFLGEKLIAGYGFRSEPAAYEQAFFKPFTRVLCELVDPYFYHLDTCFCPLNDKLAIWYPNAFSEQSQRVLKNTCELITVAEDEAQYFACNAVVVNNHIILPSGCIKLVRELAARGFIVHQCDMSEYLKAGGACKCLTLKLEGK